MALERWQTTEEMDDFSLVNSMLMIGAIAFLKVGVQESERLDEIRRVAYAATLAIDHRNMGRRIPDELIEDTREGLTTAQMIFSDAPCSTAFLRMRLASSAERVFFVLILCLLCTARASLAY